MVFGVLAVLFSFSTLGQVERCLPNEAPKLSSSDLAWNQPFGAMMNLFERIYQSGQRLPKRAFWSEESHQFILPYHQGSKKVVLSQQFIGAVRTHIEKALSRGYADAVFFSDLGHSHMLIPTEKYQREYRGYPVQRFDEFYTKAFADPDIRFLYHTAEQLNTSGSDPHMVWRQFNRNLVGENKPEGEVHVLPGYHESGHTLREAHGYEWYSSGFNISASDKGCFSYRQLDGSIKYFDISLYDLEPSSAGGMF